MHFQQLGGDFGTAQKFKNLFAAKIFRESKTLEFGILTLIEILYFDFGEY